MIINGRRENREGAQIRKCKDRDIWMVSIQIKGKRKRFYSRTKTEVKNKIKSFEREAALGVDPSNQTLSDYLLEWIPDRDLEAKTIYARHLSRKRLEKVGLGDVKLSDLTPRRIKKAYDQLRDTESLSD